MSATTYWTKMYESSCYSKLSKFNPLKIEQVHPRHQQKKQQPHGHRCFKKFFKSYAFFC